MPSPEPIDACQKCVCSHSRWQHQLMDDVGTKQGKTPIVEPKRCQKCDCAEYLANRGNTDDK